jgi:chromate transporter
VPHVCNRALGSILTTWVTFVPCFLWIFAGAPFVERLRGNRALSSALTAITAAVVGVILNLAVWFAIHTLFTRTRTVDFIGGGFDVPVVTSLNVASLVLALGAAIAVFRFKIGMISVLLACALLGAAYVLIV